MTPSTSDYIRFHARHTPRAVALIESRRKIDYATFHRDLGKMTRALRRGRLRRGSVVAVAWEGTYLHWLILLACEDLGVATVSFLANEQKSLEPLLPHVHLVVASKAPPGAGKKWQRLTQAWLDEVFARPDEEAASDARSTPFAPGDPWRLRRSSGTTGSAKIMVTTRAYGERSVQSGLLAIGLAPGSRLLLATPFTVGLTYSLATACLRLGATCIGPTADLAAAITQHRPTHARLLPFQAESLVSGLPAGFRKPGDLTLNIGAAPLSAALRKKLLARVASRIVYSYGSNETGIIGEFGADGLCTAYAGVELEIVDPRDAPVADGRLGQVRIRTPDMVSNYLGNPEATARAFRDGWFYTGDAAIMPAPGRFRLLGRADEMLNLGGRKFIPDEVEKLIASRVALQDVGVTSIRNAEGVEVACIALVVKDTAKAREASERVVKCLPRGFGRTIIRAVGSIPRTAETGKVRRQELRKLFLRK